MLYEAHRDTFLFSPDPYRRTTVESCRDEFHRSQLFHASVIIYYLGKGRIRRWIFFLFTLFMCPLLFFSSSSWFIPFTLGLLERTIWRSIIDGDASRCWFASREKTRDWKNWEEEKVVMVVVDTRSLISVENTEVEELLMDREKNRVTRI